MPDQCAPKNVANGPANGGKTVETVKKLRDPNPTPLKRGVNEMEPSFSSAPCEVRSVGVLAPRRRQRCFLLAV